MCYDERMLESIIGGRDLRIVNARSVAWCEQKLEFLTQLKEEKKFSPKVLKDPFFEQFLQALRDKILENKEVESLQMEIALV